MARTRFIGTFLGVQTDRLGRLSLDVQVPAEALGRAALLLTYLAPRPRPFTLRLIRNDSGGVVLNAMLLEWKVNGTSGAGRVRFLVMDRVDLLTLQDQCRKSVVVDAREAEDE